MLQRVIPALFAVFLVLPATPAAAAPCWQPPVQAPIVDPFREPPCPYCAGNRGIEYATGPDTAVRSVAAGVVSWSGTIAGVRWVVVEHGDGLRATYGRLATSDLTSGARVGPRDLVGTTTSTFYFGLRRGERYVDPAPHLAHLVGRSRLIPIDHAVARPAPPPRWTCRTSGVASSGPR